MESVLIHGDCLEKLRHIPDGLVDLVTCDLPYGVTANKWDTPIDLATLWVELLRVGTKCCAFIFTATQPFATTLINSQPKLFRYDLIWEKSNATNFANANRQPLRAHETTLVFCSKQPTYNPQKTVAKKQNKNNRRTTKPGSDNYGVSKTNLFGKERIEWIDDGLRFPRTVFRVEKDQCRVNQLHPTQKPVALLEWLIKTYSNEGDVVLDPTCGSGTAGVAALKNKRHFIGIEKDPTYFEVAQKRLADAKG